MKLLLLSVLCGLVLSAVAQTKDPELSTENQKYGYVEVRPGAQIFYWLYQTTASKNITEKPLIIVFTSGPGTATSYFTNFNDIGPLDLNLNPRNSSWVHSANVLFVDSPVGSGFSSVKSADLYATTDAEVADDFVSFLRGFYKDVPEFKDVPTYIFSYDYGAKIAVQVALHIDQAVKNKTLPTILKGVGLGASWISPIDNILFTPAYLFQLGFIDTEEFDILSGETETIQNLTDTAKWNESFAAYLKFYRDIQNYTGGLNIFNVLDTKLYDFSNTRESQALADKVKSALKLNTTFNGVFNRDVFNALSLDFLKPATAVVERLLNETEISLAVYNGQLDASSSILGAINWLTNLSFKGLEDNWLSNKKEPVIVNGVVEGYKRGGSRLTFYRLLRAGHLIGKDNPAAIQYILEQITNNFKV